jgi:predicted AAA+ superfamily ATPase
MRELLLEWQELWIPEYTPRDMDSSVLGGKVPKVTLFTGCRRVGKTYLMFQVIDQLSGMEGVEREDIVYINFEDERVEWKTEVLTDLLPTLAELYGERRYHLFLDEIHHIPNWDRWVRRVFDRYPGISIYLTSSSSKLSTKEIPNALRGRTLTHEVFPLSFAEYMSFIGREMEDPDKLTRMKRVAAEKTLEVYLDLGGFPEVVLEPDRRRKIAIIQDYFRTIVALDVCDRYGISNPTLMHDYVKLVLGQTRHSTSKTYKTMRSQGQRVRKETLLDFTRYLEEAYFVFFTPIYSPRIKDRLYYPRKVYFIDNSFINHVTTRFSDDHGRRMENAVYLSLLREHGRDNIFYWKDTNGREVDFAIVEDGAVRGLIQVCHDVSDERTRDREFQALLAGAGELECKDLLLITRNRDSKEKVKGKTIDMVSLLKWLQR